MSHPQELPVPGTSLSSTRLLLGTIIFHFKASKPALFLPKPGSAGLSILHDFPWGFGNAEEGWGGQRRTQLNTTPCSFTPTWSPRARLCRGGSGRLNLTAG